MKQKFRSVMCFILSIAIIQTIIATIPMGSIPTKALTLPVIDGLKDAAYQRSYQLTTAWNWGNPDWNQRVNTDGIQGTVNYYWDEAFVYFLVEAKDLTPTTQWGAAYVPNLQKWDAIEVVYDNKLSVDGTDGVMYAKPNGGIFVTSPNIAGGINGEETPAPLINTLGVGGTFQAETDGAQFYTGNSIKTLKVNNFEYTCEFKIPKMENSIYIGVSIRNQDTQTVFPSPPTTSYVFNASVSNANNAFSIGGTILDLSQPAIPVDEAGVQVNGIKDVEYINAVNAGSFELNNYYQFPTEGVAANTDGLEGKVSYYYDNEYVYFFVEAKDPTMNTEYGALLGNDISKWDRLHVVYNSKPISSPHISGPVCSLDGAGQLFYFSKLAGGANGEEIPSQLVWTQSAPGPAFSTVFGNNPAGVSPNNGVLEGRTVNYEEFTCEFKIPRSVDNKMYIAVSIGNQSQNFNTFSQASAGIPAMGNGYVLSTGPNGNARYSDGVMIDLITDVSGVQVNGYKDIEYIGSINAGSFELNNAYTFPAGAPTTNSDGIKGKVSYYFDNDFVYFFVEATDPTLNTQYGMLLGNDITKWDRLHIVYNSKPITSPHTTGPVCNLDGAGQLFYFPKLAGGLNGEEPPAQLVWTQALPDPAFYPTFGNGPAGVAPNNGVLEGRILSTKEYTCEFKIPRTTDYLMYIAVAIGNQSQNFSNYAQASAGVPTMGTGYVLSTGANGNATTLDGVMITLINPSVQLSSFNVSIDNHITKVQPQTTVTSFKTTLSPVGGATVAFSDGLQDNGIDIIRTGTVVDINISGNITQYTIKIYGDVNGDGLIGLADLAKIKSHILQIEPLQGVFSAAGDIAAGNGISISDLLLMKKHELGISVISQN